MVPCNKNIKFKLIDHLQGQIEFGNDAWMSMNVKNSNNFVNWCDWYNCCNQRWL